MFSVTIEGEREVVDAWGTAWRTVRRGTRAGVAKGCAEGAAEARSRHPWKNRTGETEAAIGGQLLSESELGADGEITSKAKHSSYLEEGTAAHTITPRSAGGALVFQWQGRTWSLRSVHHPGTKPLPFMGLAYLKCERVVVREVESSVVQAQQVLDR